MAPPFGFAGKVWSVGMVPAWRRRTAGNGAGWEISRRGSNPVCRSRYEGWM